MQQKQILKMQNNTSKNTSKFAKEVHVASLKSEAYKLDINRLLPVPVDLSKPSDVVKMLLKKMYVMPRLKILKIKVSTLPT